MDDDNVFDAVHSNDGSVDLADNLSDFQEESSAAGFSDSSDSLDRLVDTTDSIYNLMLESSPGDSQEQSEIVDYSDNLAVIHQDLQIVTLLLLALLIFFVFKSFIGRFNRFLR